MRRAVKKLFSCVKKEKAQAQAQAQAEIDSALAPGDIRSLVCQSCWIDLFSTTEYWNVCNQNDDSLGGAPKRSARHRISGPQAAVKAGSCNWCSLISRLLQSGSNAHDNDKSKTGDVYLAQKFYSRPTSTPPGNNSWGISITVPSESPSKWHLVDAHTDAHDEAASRITARPVQVDVDTEYAVRQIKSWLKNCETHIGCPDRHGTQLPTRVIDVGSKLDLTLPKIHVSHGEHGQYAALSYCWGGQQRGRVTRQNLPQCLEALDINEISQTIKDAMQVVKAVGLSYLWVDALCIVQDDENDKSHEISKMDLTYTNALFTILAQTASSAEQGFLEPRTPPPASYKLPFRCAGGNFGTMSLYYRGVKLDNFSQVTHMTRTFSVPPKPEPENRQTVTVQIHHDGTVSAVSRPISPIEPLEDRAWAFQEALLSPRLLIYNSSTLKWYCRGGEYNLGSSFSANHHQLDTLSAVRSLDEERSAHERDVRKPVRGELDPWYDVVSQYSARKLTDPADRLLALGGIAKTLAKDRHSRYLAGLWDDSLLEHLLWEPQHQSSSSDEESDNKESDNEESNNKESEDRDRCSQPTAYRAPSWSWASVEGQIHFPKNSISPVAKILQCEVNPTNLGNPFGALRGGWFVIESYMWRGYHSICMNIDDGRPKLDMSKRKIRWKGTDGYVENTLNEISCGSDGIIPDRRWRINLDAEELRLAGNADFLVISGTKKSWQRSDDLRKIIGLVLQELADGTYKRIGLFESYDNLDDKDFSPPDFPATPKRTVKIV